MHIWSGKIREKSGENDLINRYTPCIPMGIDCLDLVGIEWRFFEKGLGMGIRGDGDGDFCQAFVGMGRGWG